MSRRHDALIPLTHDHHHSLAQAKRLLEVAALPEIRDRRNAANDFVNFYFARSVRHFHEEEELFFPPLLDHPEGRDLVVRAVTDHLRLHGLVRRVVRGLSEGEVDTDLLEELATLLTDHVRFEENELFPLIEKTVPEDELVDLGTSGRRDV